MKKVLALVFSLITLSVFAQTSHTVVKKDGSTVTISLDEFDRVYFGYDEPTQPEVIIDTQIEYITDTVVTEVPVEVIKEVVKVDTIINEVVKEVPVEIVKIDTVVNEVIKEVEVEKLVEVVKIDTIINEVIKEVEIPIEKIVEVRDTIINEKLVHDTINIKTTQLIHDTVSIATVPDAVKKILFSSDAIIEEEDGSYTQYLGFEKVTGFDNQSTEELVDVDQYGGEMLYGPSGAGDADDYFIIDPNSGFRTGLLQSMKPETDQGWGKAYWSGGFALSNYGSDDIDNGGFMNQLEVYSKTQGQSNNGSMNSDFFIMGYGYNDVEPTMVSFDSRPAIDYSGSLFTIKSFDFNNGTYLLNSVSYGDGFNTAATSDTWIAIRLDGYANDELVYSENVAYLVKDGIPVTEWTTANVDMPYVDYVRFNMVASDDQSGSYGLNVPAYMALDNFIVNYK